MKNNLLHKFKDYDITPEQWAVLNRLWVRNGISPKELAELTSKDQPTTNGATAIADMERALSLQNQTYLYFREMSNNFGSVQAFLLIVVIFISVLKPWGVKKGKNI